jgi:hypothetical protein
MIEKLRIFSGGKTDTSNEEVGTWVDKERYWLFDTLEWVAFLPSWPTNRFPHDKSVLGECAVG